MKTYEGEIEQYSLRSVFEAEIREIWTVTQNIIVKLWVHYNFSEIYENQKLQKIFWSHKF